LIALLDWLGECLGAVPAELCPARAASDMRVCGAWLWRVRRASDRQRVAVLHLTLTGRRFKRLRLRIHSIVGVPCARLNGVCPPRRQNRAAAPRLQPSATAR
jgi:hypothetical protein